jgi:hypothetical protein
VVESEPTYAYVRGNPVNKLDPSGFFSSKIIEQSLKSGQGLREAFRDRSGLYWLLRNAVVEDKVTPLVIDFVFSDHKYPLRTPKNGMAARIYCEDQQLRFENGSHNFNLSQYLDYLDSVAMQQDKSMVWRTKTMELHYYELNNSNSGNSYYHDFIKNSYSKRQLPDYVGDSTSLPFEFSISVGGANLFDRYGNYYKVVNAGPGFGLSTPTKEAPPGEKPYATGDPAPFGLVGGTYVEGYYYNGFFWGGYLMRIRCRHP